MTANVLVCDDSLYVRHVVRRILELNGYRVAGEASNGREAVDRYRALRPDIVTMDLQMPELDGIGATREIIAGDPDAAIILCSGATQERVIGLARTAGARDYVVKPFTARTLLRALQRVGSRRMSNPGHSRDDEGVSTG